MHLQRIGELMYRMGIGRRYLGYGIILQAVELMLQDEDCLLCVKTGIYEPLGRKRRCSWRTIERNIRTVIHRAWCTAPETMMSLTKWPLDHEPTVSEFLDILSAALLRNER